MRDPTLNTPQVQALVAYIKLRGYYTVHEVNTLFYMKDHGFSARRAAHIMLQALKAHQDPMMVARNAVVIDNFKGFGDATDAAAYAFRYFANNWKLREDS